MEFLSVIYKLVIVRTVTLSVSVLEWHLMNYPSAMDKNTLLVVAIAIFIWVSWYIKLCNGETQKMLRAIWRTFLTLTH